MDIQIQNLSRPAALPPVLPLQYLSPQQLGTPDSGVAATLAGTNEGEAVAAPLAQMGEHLEEYYSPQAEAQRKAAIAQAALETTNATQADQAAQATPNVPLQTRQLEGAKLDAETGLVAPQAALAHAQIGSEEAELPTKTAATIAGQTAQQQAATNAVNTTPNVPPPNQTADDATLEAEKLQNANAQNAALEQAKQKRDVELASNPYLQVSTDGSVSIPEGHYIENGKLAQDTVVQRSVTGPDGKIYNQNVWAHSGKPVSYLQDGLAARNATITNMQQRFGAMNGITTPDAPQVYQAVAGAKGTDLVDPTTGQPASLPPALVQPARKIAQQFTSQPDVQMILKATPNINNAINNFQQSMNAQTGVESVEALNEAGRAFRGAVPTNEELNMLLNTAGLPAKADNLVRSIWNGDPIAPEQKADYMSALNQLKQSNDAYIGGKYNTYVKSLDTRMQPYADQLFPAAQQFVHPAQQTGTPAAPAAQAAAPADTSSFARPQTPADYAKLPSGTKYIDPQGNVGTKP